MHRILLCQMPKERLLFRPSTKFSCASFFLFPGIRERLDRNLVDAGVTAGEASLFSPTSAFDSQLDDVGPIRILQRCAVWCGAQSQQRPTP